MAYSETRFERGAAYDTSGTSWFVGIIVALALMAIGYLVFSANDGPSAPLLTSAHVNVEILSGGHGSATHVGDGLYVTAAHVATGPVTLNGAEAEILWTNTEYDIALLRGPDIAAFVPLACYTAAVGDVGQAHGNPVDLTDVTTTLTVAGEPREVGAWKLAMPMDGVLGPGMSGGGWVVGGALAGVNVAMAMAPASGFPSFYGISLVVPSSVVCQLMGRT